MEYIIGKSPVSSIVRDGRTLRGMSKKGHFFYPVTKGQPYVDEESNPRSFEYKNQKYRIEYFDGCFFPFVVKQEVI